MVTTKSHRARKKKRDLSIKVTALQLAQAESSALRQVTLTGNTLQVTSKYGHAPREKPAHTIRIAMENFNSLCVMSGNVKITALNNMCPKYKVDILCGCETQIDWRQVPQSRKFHNLFGAGTETRSVVAHNINERMQPNQFGGCAMMAMNTISSEVIDTGVDIMGLGRWCWMLLGSGRKKTRIVMAYQPSNSGRSAGTTVKDQQTRYFQVLGDARSPRTIFYEQLVSQLAIWKTSDNDIILMGDFNEHIYNGRLARRISADDLNFKEMCHLHTGIPLPPTF
jgi:exonuclease III